ncbi:MAG: RNA methyltransferase [Deltaproteobacteria bacterium]|nr:RNA methyltransferase [Deltaproteobacteria bacterium]
MKERKAIDNIAVVLNRPKHEGNIGSAARCAMNMGIEHLVVVRRSDYDRGKILQMATHFAAPIIDSIRYAEDLREALAPFQYIVGTTSRAGNTNLKRAMTDPRSMGVSLAVMAPKNKVALLFGPEDRGLTNDELTLCDLIVSIPTEDRMRSINLSHAVMLICYEAYRAVGEVRAPFSPRLATVAEREKMYDLLRDTLLRINFINPQNPEYSMVSIRQFLSRSELTAKDVKIIMGLCRQIELYGKGKTKDLTFNTGKLKKSGT